MQLSNKKIIVTGGPTREWIDPVRYITNASSGKMGIAIADSAYHRGGEVVFIHGPIDASALSGKSYRCISVDSTADMLNAIMNEMTSNMVLIMAAAPSDYAPKNTSAVKIKKDSDNLTIEFKKNPDILKTIALIKKENAQYKDIVLIGFAAETHDVLQYGKNKLVEKELAMICINDVSRTDAGFGSDFNELTIVLKNEKIIHVHRMTKKEAADAIITVIQEEL